MRWLGQGMLVRYCSFPDKGLQNGKTSLTQRNHRHNRFAQRVLTAGSHRVVRWTSANRPLQTEHTPGLVKVPRLHAVGTGTVLAALNLIRQTFLSYRQLKIWELCCNTISQKTEMMWVDYLTTFKMIYFCCSLKKKSTFHAHFSRTLSYYYYSVLFIINMTFSPDSNNTIRRKASIPFRQSGTSDMSSCFQSYFAQAQVHLIKRYTRY